MAIEEKEEQQTLINELIEKVEKDPLPTNIFDVDETDPLVLLGKMNKILAKLKSIQALISLSDNKSDEALSNSQIAINKAIESLEASTSALTQSNEAISTATSSLDKSNEAITKSEDASSKANQSLEKSTEALRISQEALDQVIETTGSKVYDNHGNLMGTVRFSGHNGINVDMDETDPSEFNIRLDTQFIESINQMQTTIESQGQAITKNSQDIDKNTQDIEQILPRLTTVESTASANASHLDSVEQAIGVQGQQINNCVDLTSEQTISGKKTFNAEQIIGNARFFSDTKGVFNIDPRYSEASGQLKIGGKWVKGYITSSQGAYSVTFSNGLIINWGSSSISKYFMQLTFAKAFSNTNYAVITQFERANSIGNYNNSQGINNRTKTGCQVYAGYSEQATVRWIAIGY